MHGICFICFQIRWNHATPQKILLCKTGAEAKISIPTWNLWEMCWWLEVNILENLEPTHLCYRIFNGTFTGHSIREIHLWRFSLRKKKSLTTSPVALHAMAPRGDTGLFLICGAGILLSKMLTLFPAFLIYLWRTHFWPSHNICKCHKPEQEFYWGH